MTNSEMNLPLPTFSFVIPAYNEAADIADSLKAVWDQQRSAKEVIVVDDGSTDGTTGILRDLASSGRNVTLIEHAENRGLAAARNTGVQAATGDVVVFLDADDQPAPDFLERIAPYYTQGFDCVCVESQVMHDDLFGRYMQAEHEVFYRPDRWVGYSAAFSCRRGAALAALFPEVLPGAGGYEDVEFFNRLMDRGFSVATDFSIMIGLRVPADARGFWKQRVSRGLSAPYLCRFVKGRPMPVVAGRRALAVGRTLALLLLIVPALIGAFRRARRSPRRLRDLPAFWLLYHVARIARHIGEWRSVYEILRRGGTSARPTGHEALSTSE